MTVDKINQEVEKYLRRNQNSLTQVEHWKRRIKEIAQASASKSNRQQKGK